MGVPTPPRMGVPEPTRTADVRDGFERALAVLRERNSRQISEFRFVALAVVISLQAFFLWAWEDWTGAPMGPLLGYAVVAGVAWRLRSRFDAWARWSGYTIAAVDLPMAYWLVTASADATVAAGDRELAGGVLMMLPLTYAGFLVMASLALDVKQTLVVAVAAVLLQARALRLTDHDFTFIAMATSFTVLTAAVCVYWRDQTVRLVRETSLEQSRRERLGRYFSPQVAALVEAGGLEDGAGRREVTVVFADLRDFTRLAERLDPSDVVRLLNRFHSAMVDAVFAHGGTLDKYLGDGLMAYFGAPVEQHDQAARAVRCALQMQSSLATIDHDGPDGLRMGIGIHTGVAVVGDIGAERRREFTVIGDAVNVAARLEQLTKQYDVPILVSGTTAAAAAGAARFRLVDRVALRGREQEVEVYALDREPAAA